MLTEDVFTHASIEPSSHHRGGIEAEHRSCIEPRIELSASSIEAGAQPAQSMPNPAQPMLFFSPPYSDSACGTRRVWGACTSLHKV
jgi:hypothetical protein